MKDFKYSFGISTNFIVQKPNISPTVVPKVRGPGNKPGKFFEKSRAPPPQVPLLWNSGKANPWSHLAWPMERIGISVLWKICPHLSGTWHINSAWVLFCCFVCLWVFWALLLLRVLGSLLENIGLRFYFSYPLGDVGWVISWWLKLVAEKRDKASGRFIWVTCLEEVSTPPLWPHPTLGCGDGQKGCWTDIQYYPIYRIFPMN